LLARLRWALAHPDQARALAAELRPAVACFDWAEMGPRYDEAMAAEVKTRSVKRDSTRPHWLAAGC